MANALAHRAFGGLAAALPMALDTAPENERFVLGAAMVAAGIAGAAAPDLLEPALSPHHRAFFHSMMTLALASGSIWWLWNWRPETFEGRLLRATALGFLAGYVSHLAIDATTPMSIPLV